MASQQRSQAPLRERERSAILHAIASRITDGELDLASVAQDAGVNRNKVNQVLKSERGVTFTGYLNRLRLAEAARLLAACDSASVTGIAYTVGYNNVSYFNRLFKREYGCAPRAFRALSPRPAAVLDRAQEKQP